MKQIVKLFMAGTCVLALGACRNDIDYDACGQIEAVQITVSAEKFSPLIWRKATICTKVRFSEP